MPRKLEATKLAQTFRSCEPLYFATRVVKKAIKEGPKAARRLLDERQGYHRLPEKKVQTDAPQRPLALVDQQEAARQRQIVFPRGITFSILVPLYNTPLRFLDEMIQSVLDQTYGGWELCLADGSDAAHEAVGERCRAWQEKDARIRYEKLAQNMGISGNTNACIDMATGEYIALFDHDDLLHPFALHEVMQAVCGKGADLVYTDEFVFESPSLRNIVSTHYKPTFAPDNLRANNYICHFTCFSRALLDKAGRFDPAYDGAQDFDLVLRLTEKAETIVHVPKMLYLWRSHPASTASDITAKPYAITAGRRAVEAHLQRQGVEATVASCEQFPALYRVRYPLPEGAQVSVIVHGAGDKAARMRCVASARATAWPDLEIIEAEDAQLLGAAQAAKGEYLALMDERVEATDAGWLAELLRQAARPEVAAVGALMKDAAGDVVHAGMVLGAGKARLCDMAFRGWKGDSIGYMGRLCYAQDVSAVCGACMVLRRADFLAMGGLDAAMGVYGDVDLCLRLRGDGRRILWTPEAALTWHVDKGPRPEGSAQEQAAFRERWRAQLEEGDPYYNPNFSLRSAGFEFARRVAVK